MKQGQATYKQKTTNWQKIESIHQYIHYSTVENNSHRRLSQLLYCNASSVRLVVDGAQNKLFYLFILFIYLFCSAYIAHMVLFGVHHPSTSHHLFCVQCGSVCVRAMMTTVYDRLPWLVVLCQSAEPAICFSLLVNLRTPQQARKNLSRAGQIFWWRH